MRKDARNLPLATKGEDGKYTRVINIDNKRVPCKEYCYWNSANTRVKPAYKKRFPSYKDVYLDETFINYENFVEWARCQIGFMSMGYVMDKDIIGKTTNNLNYSTKTCVFIPLEINGFFIIRNSAVKHYTGVSFQQDCEKYIVSCSQLNSKNKTLARVKCPIEGYNIYRSEKIRLAKILSKEYCGLIDQRVIHVLENFDKYIDLFTINPTNKRRDYE